MDKLKLLADDKIPYVCDFFTQYAELIFLPGEKITQHDLKEIDILLTRTVTPVHAPLLENTRVRFVGTATTGTDHIDEAWLTEQKITLATAAGANANAVGEYISACVAALEKKQLFNASHKIAGIIGYGRIGSIVAKALASRGLNVIAYDPFLTNDAPIPLVSLDTLMRDADLISIHTPLTTTGPYPTFHLINDALLRSVKPHSILMNAARGEVIDQAALLHTENITVCLDVWENEPNISLELLNKVTIGTPHIAGYSQEAKYRATEMMYEQAAAFFGWSVKARTIKMAKGAEGSYDPIAHTEQFREAFVGCEMDDVKEIFIRERKNYPLR